MLSLPGAGTSALLVAGEATVAMGSASLKIAGLVALMLGGQACSGNGDVSMRLQGCDVTVSRFGDAVLAEEADAADFARQTVAFFQRVSPAAMAEALSGVAPGAVMRADTLFAGGDTGWRLWRPVAVPDDPDAFYDEPAQAHYLIRPGPGAPYDSLVLVGVPAEAGRLSQPALAGRLSAGGDMPYFTIEPVAPARCTVDPASVPVDLEGLLAESGQP